MMAHIRYATRGEVSLENVHPFTRVWKGVQMCFCHNGDCPKFSDGNKTIRLGKTKHINYHPVGDTDSEAVFCAILNAMSAEFPGETELPTLPVLHTFLKRICDEIIKESDSEHSTCIFNFLLGCGQYTLFAYSWPGRRPNSQVWNGLHYIVRQPPFTTAKLLDVDYGIDFSARNVEGDRVAVIATKPLTGEEGWIEFKRGELIMFDKGLPHLTSKCCESVEKEGRGLFSRCFSGARKSSNGNCNCSASCKNSSASSGTATSCGLSPRISMMAAKILPISTSASSPPLPAVPSLVPSSALSSSSTVSNQPVPALSYCKEERDERNEGGVNGEKSAVVGLESSVVPSQLAA